MGQREVIKFLEDKRSINEDWFAVVDVEKGLKDRGFSNGVIKGVCNDLYKLAAFNLIQWKGEGIWKHRKVFRAKKKYI